MADSAGKKHPLLVICGAIAALVAFAGGVVALIGGVNQVTSSEKKIDRTLAAGFWHERYFPDRTERSSDYAREHDVDASFSSLHEASEERHYWDDQVDQVPDESIKVTEDPSSGTNYFKVSYTVYFQSHSCAHARRQCADEAIVVKAKLTCTSWVQRNVPGFGCSKSNIRLHDAEVISDESLGTYHKPRR